MDRMAQAPRTVELPSSGIDARAQSVENQSHIVRTLMAAPITFVVPGVRGATALRGAGGAAPPPRVGRVKDSILVTAQRAAGEGEARTAAVPGEDVVVLTVSGGPELWLHPETARDLLDAQRDPLRQRGSATIAAGDVAVPTRLQWQLEDASPTRGATRGFLGDVFVKTVEVITGLAEDKAADFVASKVVKSFDGQVDEGVYRLDARRLEPLKGQSHSPIAPGSGASLVLIHGTFSQTAGTFGKLWASHPEIVQQLFSAYGGGVYALDHATLGRSPIENAITLAQASPDGARLHLLTHSRGGLVAEVLARVCADPRAPIGGWFEGDPESGARLAELAAIVARKRIQIDRVVRVACPARGTLLASKRFDAYLSVVKWALELAQIPVAPQLLDLLGEVARRRADPDALPGLAAQIPNSPLVQWLHGDNAAVRGELRVVAGDMQGDSVVSWVKTLLSDAFFWTDNDLVVQTRSMYGGTPRDTRSLFVLDQGGKVSHFTYFSNAQTAASIAGALTEDSPDGFRVIGPLSWSGESATGVRAAIATRAAATAPERPALFLLPGILGSNLAVDHQRVWLAWRLVNGFSRLAYDETSTAVTPDGPIGLYYDDLLAFFAPDYDIKPFAFDWRRPIRAEAERLAAEVGAAVAERKQSGQPVRMIAHSMGGLVARTMQIVAADAWNAMMRVDGARLLMLGTPNNGSWAPMQVLSGDDTFGNLLTTVGAPFHGDATRQVIAAFPGLMELQANILGELGDQAVWRRLADDDVKAIRARSIWHRLPIQIEQFEWGVPAQPILDEARQLWTELRRQQETDLPSFAHKLLLVVGQAPLTPAGYESTDAGLVYLNAANGGDGRVLLDSARLPGVATWTLDADHGSLPRRREAFDAYKELLAKGTTSRLPALSTTRGAAALPAMVRTRPSRVALSTAPPQSQGEVLAATGPAAPVASPTAAALRITVVNGDLTYISEPLLIGHYRSWKLSGAEAAMDRAIGGAMSASLRRGHYPQAVGASQIFANVTTDRDNPWQVPRPEAVIVAGLGSEGELRGVDLASTVRQAVIGFAQRLTERTPIPASFSLATTLLGSGGSGITAGQAGQLIAQGVREANEQLTSGGVGQPWPRVDHLRIVELYLDRAAEAWNALQALDASAASRYALTPAIEPGTGSLPRTADAGYRGAAYDFISALVAGRSADNEEIVYTVNTKRARSDVRPQAIQVPLIRSLVLTASNAGNGDAQIGRTLFNLLVPTDLEPFLGSSIETVLELDDSSAGIPWEVLEAPASGGGDRRPWSIRTKLLRKLRATPPSFAVNDATTTDGILVVGDPACDRSKYPVLTGARREALEVAACLTTRRDSRDADTPRVVTVISDASVSEEQPDAIEVLNAVMGQPWRIIHIAAHGEPPLELPSGNNPRGVVLSGESFLGPREITGLRVVPELVFVNCCHLASAGTRALCLPTNYDRARFAAGVAQALIRGGVRCVVAAGWAVDDEAASTFATEFYARLRDGARFIDAVAAARERAYDCGGNTWAAYQCYGDPDWQFNEGGDAQRPRSVRDEFASIATPSALIVALDTIAVQTEFQQTNAERQAERITFLETAFTRYANRGDVAQAFGNAWAKLARFEEAVVWYDRARKAEDGTATLGAIEQLANAKVRAAWNRVSSGEQGSGAIAGAREEIADAIRLLETLLAIGPTLERESIYGSAYKRLALLEAAAGRPDEEQRAIANMWTHYSAAESIARTAGAGRDGRPSPLFYPAMNRIAAQLGLPDADSRSAAMDAQTLEAIRGSLSSTPPDFWSVVGHTELDMYVAIAAGQLAQHVDSLVNDFGRHHERVGSRRMWGSVLDDATFVLSRYQRVASPGEQRAAGRLLDTLGILAGRPVAAARPAATAAERRPARKAPAVRKGKRQKPAKPAASTGTKRRPGRKRPRR
jgi:tetratricopeptide (TPR) repeat protein